MSTAVAATVVAGCAALDTAAGASPPDEKSPPMPRPIATPAARVQDQVGNSLALEPSCVTQGGRPAPRPKGLSSRASSAAAIVTGVSVVKLGCGAAASGSCPEMTAGLTSGGASRSAAVTWLRSMRASLSSRSAQVGAGGGASRGWPGRPCRSRSAAAAVAALRVPRESGSRPGPRDPRRARRPRARRPQRPATERPIALRRPRVASEGGVPLLTTSRPSKTRSHPHLRTSLATLDRRAGDHQ